jgi:hypothetical protein
MTSPSDQHERSPVGSPGPHTNVHKTSTFSPVRNKDFNCRIFFVLKLFYLLAYVLYNSFVIPSVELNNILDFPPHNDPYDCFLPQIILNVY